MFQYHALLVRSHTSRNIVHRTHKMMGIRSHTSNDIDFHPFDDVGHSVSKSEARSHFGSRPDSSQSYNRDGHNSYRVPSGPNNKLAGSYHPVEDVVAPTTPPWSNDDSSHLDVVDVVAQDDPSLSLDDDGHPCDWTTNFVVEFGIW